MARKAFPCLLLDGGFFEEEGKERKSQNEVTALFQRPNPSLLNHRLSSVGTHQATSLTTSAVCSRLAK